MLFYYVPLETSCPSAFSMSTHAVNVAVAKESATATATKTVEFVSPYLEGGAVPVGHLQLWGVCRRSLQCLEVFADILLHH